MSIELNARAKEIQRIMSVLADIPCKTFYDCTVEEYTKQIVTSCMGDWCNGNTPDSDSEV